MQEFEKQRIVEDNFSTYTDFMLMPNMDDQPIPDTCFDVMGETVDDAAHLEFFFSGTFLPATDMTDFSSVYEIALVKDGTVVAKSAYTPDDN